MRIIVITGLAGSGKSTAVRVLEDEGFFCLDNLPGALFPTFIDLVANSKVKVDGVALVMDIRGRDFLEGYEEVFEQVRAAGHKLEIIYFDATDDVLIRRFSETRRRHPVSANGSVLEGIRFERVQLAGLHRLATTIIDTSELNVHQLRELVLTIVKGAQGARGMTLHVQSFGYRYGIPLESDLVMDVRFLQNPFFVQELKGFSGLDQRVREFVLENAETTAFLQKFQDLLVFLVPQYRREGKSHLNISIGCTGGRHRSVVIVEELCEFFRIKQFNYKVTHRDMEKG
jgi:UPF0042 nucleotide-binding protein